MALPYAPSLDDPRPRPRLHVGAVFLAGQERPRALAPLVDTGAEASIFDGEAADAAGWPMDEIARRAIGVVPISGIGRRGRPIEGYLLEVTCDVVAGARLAELRFRAAITPPSTTAFPVLGRGGFLEQVDVTFAELDRTLYLRFRDPALRRLFR